MLDFEELKSMRRTEILIDRVGCKDFKYNKNGKFYNCYIHNKQIKWCVNLLTQSISTEILDIYENKIKENIRRLFNG